MADSAGNRKHDAGGYYINIEGYYDQIHRTTWARRTAGLFAGATLGAAYGSLVGAVAAFVPYVLGAAGMAAGIPLSAAVAAVPASVALFAAIAATMGMAITADVAANAASSAVGLEEKERREKLEDMKSKGIGPDISPFISSGKDADEKGPPLFNWKVAAVTAPLFAAFGALIAFNPYTASLVFGQAPFTNLIGNTAATVTASASVFGMFGAFMGMKSSLLTNQLANFYYKVITGELFEKSPQTETAVQVKREAAGEKATQHAIDEPSRPAKSYAASEKARFSLQELIEKTDKRNPDQEVALTR